MKKDRLDGFGAISLLGITLLLAVNQVIVVEVNKGLQPVFFAGLRSILAVFFILAWLRWSQKPLMLRRKDILPGLVAGTLFAAEFMCLFLALEKTSLGRTSVIFYSMPVWLAVLAHFFLPGDRLTATRVLGLAIAFAGTAFAILSRHSETSGSLTGDLLALGASIGWAATAFAARKTSLREVGPEAQLFWMALVSGPILLACSGLFGPLVRDLTAYHILGLFFQSTVVMAGGFIFWLWLLSVYPTATVASFSFLTPVFAILFGVLLYGEAVTVTLAVSLLLVAVGIALINRRS